MPVEAKVANILNARELVINKGGKDGVKEDMIFKIVEPQIQVLDPETNDLLGDLSREKIRIKVSEVHARFSVGRTFTNRVPYYWTNPVHAYSIEDRMKQVGRLDDITKNSPRSLAPTISPLNGHH